MAEVYADEQLKTRNFFVPLPGLMRNGAAVPVPGIPMKSAAMRPRLGKPAPRIGEHNHQILAGPLPGKSAALSTLQNPGGRRAGPLAGIRVADF
jgi:crotonobetainyl-CoA:carnitine CoA-transferase CaiB-like acyl-CoA transferase